MQQTESPNHRSSGQRSSGQRSCGNTPSGESARRCDFRTGDSRGGLTVLELLVTMSIIGVLVALLLPAVSAARETSRRIQCVDHLREVGLALHNHHSDLGRLSTGWKFDPSNQSAVGWAVPLLPYLGQPGLAERIDDTKTVADRSFEIARRTPLEVMLCPSDIVEPTFLLFAGVGDEDDAIRTSDTALTLTPLVELPTANYVGVFGTLEPDDVIPAPVGDGSFLENRPMRFRDFQRGLSQTIVVGERTMAQVPSTWLGVSMAGEDAAARLVGAALEGVNNPLADESDFSSRHAGGANFLWGDGHVSFVSQHIDLREYHRIAQLRIHSSD